MKTGCGRRLRRQSTALQAAAWLVGLALWAPEPARALYGDRLEDFGVDGGVRTTTLATRNYDAPLLFGSGNKGDGMAQTTLRLVAGGQAAPWLKFEVHGVQMLSVSAFQGPVGGTGGVLGTSGSSKGCST